MARFAPQMAVAAVLMAICAYYEGTLTSRWKPPQSEMLDEWGERLKQVPLTVGDWQGEDLPGSSEQEKAMAKFTGERAVLYRNRRTGKTVQMSLVCGLGRNVSIHTPDRCFKGQGFNLGEKIGTYTIDLPQGKSEFYTSVFTKESPDSTERVRVLWSWNNGDGWAAPAWPKAAHAWTPALYKLYLISGVPNLTEKLPDNPAILFAEEFIPLVDAALLNKGPAVETAAAEATTKAK